MAKDIIPTADADFDFFQNQVYTKSDTNRVAWGIPQVDLDDLKVLKDDWDAAWLIAKDPDERTSAEVQAKDSAREVYEPALRQFVQQWIQNNKKVSDQERVSMGIKPRDKTRTKNPVPASTPIIELKAGAASSIQVIFRYVPEGQDNSKKGKPEGIDRCEIKYKVGEPAPLTFADCPNDAAGSKSPILLSFTGTDGGKRIYVYARWVNTTNQPGPWTVIHVNMLIPG